MTEVDRISPEQARERVKNGQARLVCAYDDQNKCNSMLLQNATTYTELKNELPTLPSDQEIILYCA